jgi:hypothetical protein
MGPRRSCAVSANSSERRHCAGFSHSHTQKIRGYLVSHLNYTRRPLSQLRTLRRLFNLIDLWYDTPIYTRRRPSPQRFSPRALARPRAYVHHGAFPALDRWASARGAVRRRKGSALGAQQLHPRSPRVCRRPPSVLSVYLLENEGREGLAAVCGRGPRRWGVDDPALG